MRACAASSVPASCQISCYAQRFATLRITQPASVNPLDMILFGQRLRQEGEERIGRHQGRAGWRQQSVHPIGDDLGVLAEADDRRLQAGIGTAADIANVTMLVAVGLNGPGRTSDQPAGERFPDV